MAYSYRANRGNGQTGTPSRSSGYSYTQSHQLGANAIRANEQEAYNQRMAFAQQDADRANITRYLQDYYDTLNRATDFASSAPQSGRSVTDYQPISNELSGYVNQRDDMMETIRRVYGTNSDAERMLTDLTSYQNELGGYMSNQMSYYAGQTPSFSEYSGMTLEQMNDRIAELESARQEAAENGRDTTAADNLIRNARQYVRDNARSLSYSTPSAEAGSLLSVNLQNERERNRQNLLSDAFDAVRGSESVTDAGRNLVDFVRNAYENDRTQTAEINELNRRSTVAAERAAREAEQRELDLRSVGPLTSESSANDVLVHYGLASRADISPEEARARMEEINEILPTLHPTYDGAYDNSADPGRAYDLDARTYEQLTAEYERLHAVAWDYDQQKILDEIPAELRDAIMSGEKLGYARRMLRDLGYDRQQAADVIDYGRRQRDIQEAAEYEQRWADYISGEQFRRRAEAMTPDALRNNPVLQKVIDAQRSALAVSNPVVATLVPRTLGSLTSGVGITDAIIQATLHPMRPINWNTAAQRWSSTDEIIGDAVMNSVDWQVGDRDWFDTGYQFATSTIDSVAAGLLASATGNVAGAIASGAGAANAAAVAEAVAHITNSAIFFGSAGQSYARDAVRNGATDSQALIGAIYAGTAEALFEDLSFGAFYNGSVGLGNMESALKHTLIDMGINASEEFNTEIANILTDWMVMGGMSDIMTLYNQYLDAGYTEAEAKNMVFYAMAGRAIEAGVSGALQGGVMNAVATARARRSTAKLGQTISTEGRALLGQMTGQNLQNATDFEIGAAFSEAFEAARRDLVSTDTINAYLKKLEVSEENRPRMVSIIRGALMGHKASAEDLKFLQSDKASQEAWRGVVERDISELGNQLYAQADANRNVVALAVATGNDALIQPTIREAYALDRTLTTAPREMQETDSGFREAVQKMDISDAAKRQMENLRTVQVAEQTANKTEEVSDEQFAAQYAAAYNTGKAFYSNPTEREKVVRDYGKWAGTAYDLGAAEGRQAVRSATLSGRVDGGVYDITEEEYSKFGEGEVTAARDITDEDIAKLATKKEQSIARKTMKRRQAERAILEKVAKAMGLKIVVYESTGTSDRTANGFYEWKNGTMYINANAGTMGSRSMLRTVAHELTHVIQSRAPAEYAALKQYITDRYNNGDSALLEQRVGEVIENNPGIGAEFAMDEVIADACEMMLKDSKAIQELYRTHEELFDRIANFIKDFVAEMKKAFAGVGVLSESARDMMNYWDGIQKLWDKGLVAAALKEQEAQEAAEVDQRVADGKTISYNQEVQYSRSKDEQFMRAAYKANKILPRHTLDLAARIRTYIRDYLDQHEEELNLPPDVDKNTFISDSSYGGTEELTTVCVRSLAAQALMDEVADRLGRPLTVADTIFISQELMTLTDRPECIYCYVAADRKSYREFLGRYVQQRDAADKRAADGMEYDTNYTEFLGDRGEAGDTDNMKRRFRLWMNTPADMRISAADVANLNRMFGEFAELQQKVLKSKKDIVKQYVAFLDRLEQGKYTADELRYWQYYDAMQYSQSASWAKKMINYTAYNGHILKWKQSRVDYLNDHYGMRMYSFSDFSPAFILENMQMFTDAAVRGLKVLAYTKELDFAEIFAPTGANIEISVYLGTDANGNIVQDGMMGADWNRAVALRNKYPNIGITLVATDDDMIRWGRGNPNVDVIIPFHLVRTGQQVADEFAFQVYTAMSSDKKLESADWYKDNGVPTSVSPVVHDNDIVKYIRACQEYHLTPRFEEYLVGWREFLNGEYSEDEFRELNGVTDTGPGYMKFVNETRQRASDMSPVQPKFNSLRAMRSLEDLAARGGYGVAETLGRNFAEVISDVADDAAERLRTLHSGEDIVQYSVRKAPAPKKTVTVYKLMRLMNGQLYPLFIDSTEPLKQGVWYDADSPALDFLRKLPSGIYLIDPETQSAQSFANYLRETGEHPTKYPSKSAIIDASANGKRWVYIEDTEKSQKRFGESRRYWNLGINGSGAVSTFSMRPGYHAGSLPTMRQIGKGADKNLRDDSFVWTEGEIPADVNYQNEADRNPDKDIPTHIPVNGYYLKATNADAAKSQADRVGWYVAGSYKINRIVGDNEARAIIDDWNKAHPNAPVEYDYARESGRVFDADSMSLVQYAAPPSKLRSIDMVEAISNFDGIPQNVSTGIRQVQDLYEQVKANRRETARINDRLRDLKNNQAAANERTDLENRKAVLQGERDNLTRQIDSIMETEGVRNFLEAERNEVIALVEESFIKGRDYLNEYLNEPLADARAEAQAQTERADNAVATGNRLLREERQNSREAVRDAVAQQREADQRRYDRREQEWQDRLSRLRQRYTDTRLRQLARQADELRTGFRNRIARMQERQAAIALRATARQRLQNLSDMVTLNNDQHHIISELREPVAQFIAALDPIPRGNSQRAIRQAAAWQNSINAIVNLLQNNNTPAVTSLIIEQYRDVFDALANDLAVIVQELNGTNLAPQYRQNLEALAQGQDRDALIARGMLGAEVLSGATILDLMTAEQLGNLNRAIRAVQILVNTANRVFANARYQTRQDMVNDAHDELSNIEGDPAIIRGNGKRQGQTEQASLRTQRFLGWRNSTPYYAFKRMGEVAKNLYLSLAKGWGQMAQDNHATNVALRQEISEEQARQWRRETVEIHPTDAAGRTHTVRITQAQLMSLYCHFRQEQSLRHIGGGGFRFTGTDQTRSDTTNYHMSLAEAQRMFDQLMPAGSEMRHAAEWLQEYMARVGAEYGNVVSRALYGYEYFDRNDIHYFPIKSADDQHQTRLSDRGNSLYALLHMTETRARNPRANTTLIVSDIFDVFAVHMADMVKYKNLALPVLDIANWLNGRASDGETIKHDLLAAFGGIRNGDDTSSIAEEYVSKFLRDVNASYNGGGLVDQEANRFLTRMKRAAVGASLRVALQQPFSYIRAMYTMNPKYLNRALAPNGNLNRDIEEALRYSGLARAKADGAFTSDTAPTIREQILGPENWRDAVSNRALWLAEQMDQRTWGVLWRAAKYQVNDEPGHPRPGTEEYFQRVREVFDEVILSTQVMDGTLTRSAFMRDTTMYSKIMTAFMAEPTLTYNMLLDGLSGLRMARRTGGNTRAATANLARAIGTWAGTQLANALITALVDGLRDDDDYERFIDKFVDHFKSNIINNLNPLEGIPLIKTAWDLIVSTWKGSKSPLGTEFQGITSAVKSIKAIYDTLRGEKTEANYYGKTTTWGLIFSALQALSYLSGLPVANAVRIGPGAYNFVAQVWNEVFAPKTGNYWKHATTYESENPGYDALFQAEVNGNDTRVRNLMLELASHDVDGDTINKEMRSRTRDAFVAGEIGEQKARTILSEYGVKDEDIDDYINLWKFKRDFPSVTSPTESIANAYYNTFQGMGVSPTDFSTYWKYIHGTGITQNDVRNYISELQVPGNVKRALWHTRYDSEW